MIVQRYNKVGDYWQDIVIPSPIPHSMIDWLGTLPDDVGTEYRIMHGMASMAIMKERNNPTRYVCWKQDSE